jgi:hypothetical protein
LQKLPHLPKPELLALWRELFAQSAHPRLRRNLMIPILAYRIQEQAYGGLKSSTHKRLQKLATELEQNQKTPSPLVPRDNSAADSIAPIIPTASLTLAQAAANVVSLPSWKELINAVRRRSVVPGWIS